MSGNATGLRDRWSRLRRAHVPIVTATVVGCLTLILGGDPSFLSMSVQIGTITLIAVSFGLAYGLGGVLSAAQAAFAAGGAYSTAIMTTQFGWPLLAGMIAAMIVPAAVGYLLVRVVGGLSHMTIALATLIVGELFTTAISRGGDVTGGYVGLAGIPVLPGWLSTPLGSHLLVWCCVVLAVSVHANLAISSHGTALRTIAFDHTLARSLGIPIERQLGWLMALSTGMAGFAGWMYAHLNSFVSPDSLPVSLSISIFLMVIVGGKRSVAGPVVGAVGLSLLSYSLPGTQTQGLLYGLALVAVVLVCPTGLTSLIDTLLPAAARHATPAGAQRTGSLGESAGESRRQSAEGGGDV